MQTRCGPTAGAPGAGATTLSFESGKRSFRWAFWSTACGGTTATTQPCSRRPFRAAGDPFSQLGSSRTAAPVHPAQWLRGGAGALSSLCFARLSVGASHPDLPQAEAARRRDLAVGGRAIQGDSGWEFGTGPGTIPDNVNGKRTLAEIYLLADPHFSGRVTVPTLWDKARRTIVNNESAESSACSIRRSTASPR